MEPRTRVCLETHEVIDGEKRLVLEVGRKYLTSPEHEDGTVTVFAQYWLRAPLIWFEHDKPTPPLSEQIVRLSMELTNEARRLREAVISELARNPKPHVRATDVRRARETDRRWVIAAERDALATRLLALCT